MRGGMGWNKKIRLIRKAITYIEKGYKEPIKGKEKTDVDDELKNIKHMLFAMVQDLGVLTTCRGSAKTSLEMRLIIIGAVDDLADKNFTSLIKKLEILEEYTP